MRKHYDIRVHGLVQGVFFRASTMEVAASLDLRGFVKNQQDGSVYIEAEGKVDDLQKFIEWCHNGPAHARVSKCEVTEGALRKYSRFEIQR